MGCWRILLGLMLLLATTSAFDRKPGCSEPDMCGSVSIPYPFSIKGGCSREGFKLECNNDSINSSPKPFLGSFEVLEIMREGHLRVLTSFASDCGSQSASNYSSRYDLRETPFTFSNGLNKFTAIGCNMRAYISTRDFTSGCMSYCWNDESVIDGMCSGIGCCQTSIPPGVKIFSVSVATSVTNGSALQFDTCSYAFLTADEFKFEKKDLLINGSKYGEKTSRNVPMVLDWAIGNEMCESAQRNPSAYACKSKNSYCYNSTSGPGYLCNCSQGYEGNPYLEAGCKDINECERGTHNCTGKCKNEEGSFSCTPEIRLTAAMILGSVSGLLFLVIVGYWIYWGSKKRKLLKLKEKFFRQNGGLLLEQQIASHRVGVTTKIFSAGELERATKNYDESRIIGQGGYGTVYKGILDNITIAVKKSKIVDETQIEQFINKVVILSQINHRNVVKLLGCCLETQVPLLVYEFIPNETLFHHIHDEAHSSSLSLENRLRIASETARALSYLHSAASIPIFHRDVKSANILLDENLITKVADFGASGLVPLDQTQITTLVQGTLGYLDPEYFHTGQLTEKSGVYSFGVVLVELLTGEKPICMNRSQEERSLSMYFVTALEEHRLFQVLENRIVDEGDVGQLMAVAELAKRCLKVKGEERPSMKEVAMELEGLRRSVEHPWVQQNHEETHSLLGETSEGYNGNGNGSVIGQESLTNHTMAALEIGR